MILNPNRVAVGANRHYGLKVGDVVEYRGLNLRFACRRGVVVHLFASDNNRASVLFDGDQEPTIVVAEWCKVIGRNGFECVQ